MPCLDYSTRYFHENLLRYKIIFRLPNLFTCSTKPWYIFSDKTIQIIKMGIQWKIWINAIQVFCKRHHIASSTYVWISFPTVGRLISTVLITDKVVVSITYLQQKKSHKILLNFKNHPKNIELQFPIQFRYIIVFSKFALLCKRSPVDQSVRDCWSLHV